MRSPTQRSIQLLKEQGYVTYVAEHYNAFARVRRDLFGFIDIVALHPDKKGLLGVQTTSGANLSARIIKAESLPAFSLWLRCGNAVEFHGWRKIITGKVQRTWQPIIRRIDLADLL